MLIYAFTCAQIVFWAIRFQSPETLFQLTAYDRPTACTCITRLTVEIQSRHLYAIFVNNSSVQADYKLGMSCLCCFGLLKYARNPFGSYSLQCTLLTKYFGTEMTSVKNIFVLVVILTWLADQVEGMILVVFHAAT